jgi:hypothetical protein
MQCDGVACSVEVSFSYPVNYLLHPYPHTLHTHRYKQRGQAAKEAKNVFFYLTYPDAVDVDGIVNDTMRRATEDQIVYFGQTPKQLFKKSHPKRLSKLERQSGIRKSQFQRTAEKIKVNGNKASKSFSALISKAKQAASDKFFKKSPP